MAESGFPDLTISRWAGLLGPSGMPRPVVERINSAEVTVLARADVRDQLNRLAFNPQSSSPDEFGAFMKDQLRVWQGVAKAIGIEPE